MFPCDKCGECCKHLNKSLLYKELDRGDGSCKYLDGNLCSIYEKRPLLCRVDECYERFFKETFSLSEYYQMNKSVCISLKQNKL